MSESNELDSGRKSQNPSRWKVISGVGSGKVGARRGTGGRSKYGKKG